MSRSNDPPPCIDVINKMPFCCVADRVGGGGLLNFKHVKKQIYMTASPHCLSPTSPSPHFLPLTPPLKVDRYTLYLCLLPFLKADKHGCLFQQPLFLPFPSKSKYSYVHAIKHSHLYIHAILTYINIIHTKNIHTYIRPYMPTCMVKGM